MLNKAITTREYDVAQEDVIFPSIDQKKLGWQDIAEGLQKWPVWLMLAYQDIKLRYRRSVLGPFWITISMAITVYSMGFLYAHLFHVELEKYYPFLVAGMLAWSLISTIVMELTEALTASESLIKGFKLPYSLYIHRIVARNLIIFFHNILVIIPILLIFHKFASVNWRTLMLIPGLLLIYLNSFMFGLVIASVCARYRDVAQIIKNLVQVIFFITPIMWGPEILKGISVWIVDLNPFYAFVELVRAPLIGTLPTLSNLIMVGVISVLGFALSYKLFFRTRARIIYWL